MRGSGGLLTEYSLGVCMGQPDAQIFIGCMHGSAGLLTEYSLGVCRGQVDPRLNIHLGVCRVRRIAD
jgi:hypothetical protein